MRNRVIAFIFILIGLFSLTGCNSITINQLIEPRAPVNNNLIIKGYWQITDYKILDKNMYTSEKVNELKDTFININDNSVTINNTVYDGVKYKLKLVKGDYIISYQDNFTVKDLGVSNEEVNSISASDKNNNIFEFFFINNDKSYIYYQGVLLTVKRVGDAKEESHENNNKATNNSTILSNDYELNKGIYMTFKEPRKLKDDGTYTDESYRTLWISFKDNKIQPIEEADGIIFPRQSGIWTLSKKVLEEKGVHKEYFVANSLDKKNKSVSPEIDDSYLEDKKNIYRSLNYIGNNYISTEVYNGNNFKNNYTQYEMLPIDNLLAGKGLVFQDIVSKKYNDIYKKDYENAYAKLSKSQQQRLRKYIDYSNFGVVRDNGNWRLEGRISPANTDGEAYDYPISIQPPVNLVRYDSLFVPWKVLRNDVPSIKDAYTSPDGKMAIVIVENKLIIYRTSGNELLEPIKEFKLKDGEQVIMAEWCEGDYVDYWGNSFKEYQKQVNKEGI